jgi:hypothetical protein
MLTPEHVEFVLGRGRVPGIGQGVAGPTLAARLTRADQRGRQGQFRCSVGLVKCCMYPRAREGE